MRYDSLLNKSEQSKASGSQVRRKLWYLDRAAWMRVTSSISGFEDDGIPDYDVICEMNPALVGP